MGRFRRVMAATAAVAFAAPVLSLGSAAAVAGASAPGPAPDAGQGHRSTGELGSGWSLEGSPAGEVLVWSGPGIRMGDSRPEFRLGGQTLGFPRETSDSLVLPLSAGQAAAVRADADRLEAWSSARRLDAQAPTTADRRTTGDAALPSATPTVSTDPAAFGPYTTERLVYDLEPLVIEEYPAPVEVLAEVTRPVDAPGRRPLVLLLHGRHSTCFAGGPDGESTGEWPCPEGWSPIPSHLGYRYVTDVLASQGYVAVSISANGINGQDYASPDLGTSARSQLVRHHLALWVRWTERGGDPWGGRFRGRIDPSNVVLIGHSRGGEGVNRAAVDTPDDARYRIRGLVSYGPTAFGRQVTPDVPAAVILPACDGDVSDLQGQAYIDWSRDIADSDALRSAVIALGANHNYFNTEWTPGLAQAPAWDDWFDPEDPVCGGGGSLRLSPEHQQQVGAAYTLALVRLAVEQDPAMLPLLDGTKVKPAAIGAAEVAVTPVGGDASLLYRAEDAGMPELLAGMTGVECPGYLPWWVPPDEETPVHACNEGFWFEATPHWVSMFTVESRPAPMALELAWPGESAVARFPLGTKPTGMDLSRFDSIDVRVANDPDLPPAQLAVRVVDVRDRSALLATDLPTIEGWPGSGLLDRIQARTLRADLTDVGGVDLRKVAAIEFVTAGDGGRVWVFDVRASRHRVASPKDLDLPRVSVQTVRAPEGGSGQVTTVDVEVSIDGHVRRPATLWIQVDGTDAAGEPMRDSYPITIPVGAKDVVASVPLSYTGDDVYEPSYPGGDPLDAGVVVVAPMVGALTGEYIGGVTTVEDEDVPVLSVDVADVTATEGGEMLWTLRLSGPTAGAFYFLTAEPPPDATAELDSDDVDQDWLQEQLWWAGVDIPLPIDPPLPLSQIGREVNGYGLPVIATFAYGATEAVVEVPLRVDRMAEGDEELMLALAESPFDPTIPPGGLNLTGHVAANSETDGLPAWTEQAVVFGDVLGDDAVEEAAIDAIVGDARVVLAGEFSRGAAPAVEARTGIVADLVERRGITDVLLDEPLPSSLAAATYVAFGDGSADDAVAAFSDELRRTVEAASFLASLRAHNEFADEPVFVLGLDPGDDPSALVDLVEAHDPVAASALACFDLDPQAMGDWWARPATERDTCRATLVTVRDELAAEVTSVPRDRTGLTAHAAHAAAVALVASEATASLDPGMAGYDDAVASSRAEALASGVLAALAREPAGRVAATVDDLDAAVLRDVAEPRVVPMTSTEDPTIVTVTVARSVGAVLVDALGEADVASIGMSAGRGEIRTYTTFGADRAIVQQSLDLPIRGSVERTLSVFGPEGPAFILPLGGQDELAPSAPMRIGVRDEYLSWDPLPWYLPVSLATAFDGIVHVREVRATTLLSQRVTLELDGVPVEVVQACWSYLDGGLLVWFDGGSLTAVFVYDDVTGAFYLDMTVVTAVDTYTGLLPVVETDRWLFSGNLESEGGGVLGIAGSVPYDVAEC